MPAQSRRRVDADPDDPWGFGAPEGTLVEVRYEPHVAALGLPTAVRREPVRAADVGAIDLTPGGGLAPRHVAPDPAGDARLHLDVTNDGYRNYFTPRRRRSRLVTAVLALGLAAITGGGAYVWFLRDAAPGTAAPVAVGTFVLSSQPAGAEVLLDGVPAGRTPLALQLTPGDHTVVATAENGVSQRLSARVPAGESVAEHLMLEPSPAVVESRPRGREPVPSRDEAGAVGAAAPAPAAPRAASTPATSAPAAAPAPGFVSFDLPFAAQVYEGGTLLGSSAAGRLRVAAGTHTFTLVSQELGFRSQETVAITAGRTTRHVVEQQSAPLSVNALPWAEVFISGRSFGETPLANIPLPIGTYQVTLRHPTLGERQVAVTVRLGAANRLAVDMRP